MWETLCDGKLTAIQIQKFYLGDMESSDVELRINGRVSICGGKIRGTQTSDVYQLFLDWLCREYPCCTQYSREWRQSPLAAVLEEAREVELSSSVLP